MKRKSVFVHNNYLLLPIGKHVNSRKLLIYSEGQLVDDIDLRLDYINPIGYVYYDLRKYLGKTLEFEVRPDLEILDRQVSSELPLEHRNLNYRPRVHFTPKQGWINDPNGLLEYTSPVTGKKTYHLFFQYNPYDTIWGNMHWGHAVSEDLLHWEELPIALYPDEYGTMFSGSAIIDRDNLTGLKEGDENVILLYYTCAGHTSERSKDRQFTQCLAYSTDGGVTFRKYAGNPIIPHIAADNRDPKVIWCEEMGRYLMALYLDHSEFAILVSDDLLKWELLQKIEIDGDAECPDIYPLNVDGDPGKRKWIISAATHFYVVCEFRNGRFEIVQSPRRLHYGRNHYAAQTYSDVADGRRICIAWNRELDFPRAPFYGQMSLPMEFTLHERGTEYDLCAKPIAQLDSLVMKTEIFRDLTFSDRSPWEMALVPTAYRIRIDLGDRDDDFDMSIFGRNVHVETRNNLVRVHNTTVPLSMGGEKRQLLIVVDNCSVDLFTGDGQAIMTAPFLCDYNLKRMILTAHGTAKIASMEVSQLSPAIH